MRIYPSEFLPFCTFKENIPYIGRVRNVGSALPSATIECFAGTHDALGLGMTSATVGIVGGIIAGMAIINCFLRSLSW
jgi:hypothetical protein